MTESKPSMPRRVAACRLNEVRYPDTPPFHPSSPYPEYDFESYASNLNPVYEGVRECFRLRNLDVERQGQPDWNPLGDLIEPGERVVLKPNLVKEDHPRDPKGWRYVLTHGSVIRAVADYVWKAVGPDGSVAVADAPQTDSSFQKICEVLGLERLRDFYADQGLDLELIDMRQEEWESEDGVVVDRRELEGDPAGYVEYDLENNSEFVEHSGAGHYYGADYDSEHVNRHHSDGHHRYLIAGTAIEADVLFSLPKMKSHKKAGVTLALKNLVGINGDKNYLPHHTECGSHGAGDEHPNPDPKHRFERGIVPLFRQLALNVPVLGPRLFKAAKAVGKRIFGSTDEVVRSGNWWGNDTVWRMCLDLNKLLFYGDMDGSFREGGADNRKRHYVLCDGVLAGEGRGPMNPDPVAAGVLTFGTHPASHDAVCTWLMGFDPEKIPIVHQSFRCTHLPIAEWDWTDLQVTSNVDAWEGPLPEISDESTFHFEPHFGWKGHIRREPNELRHSHPRAAAE